MNIGLGIRPDLHKKKDLVVLQVFHLFRSEK